MKKVFEEAHPERGRPSWGRIGVHDKGQLHWQGQLPGRGGHISYMLFHNADWTNRKKALRNRRKKPAFQIWSTLLRQKKGCPEFPQGLLLQLRDGTAGVRPNIQQQIGGQESREA